MTCRAGRARTASVPSATRARWASRSSASWARRAGSSTKGFAMPRRTLRILTWHVHGNYLYYLTQVPHEWYVLSKPNRPPGYAGRAGELPWGENVHDMPVDEIASQEFDCILYQSQSHYLEDRSSILCERHQHVPRV